MSEETFQERIDRERRERREGAKALGIQARLIAKLEPFKLFGYSMVTDNSDDENGCYHPQATTTSHDYSGRPL